MTYPEAQRIVREGDEQMKDKSYRKFPIGQEWGRFLRAKRASRRRPLTLESYETVGRRFTLRFADFDSLEPFAAKGTGPELILDFLDHHYGAAAEATYTQREEVLRSFFEWAYRTDRISADPMRKVERARRRQEGARRDRIPKGALHSLLGGPHSDRDYCGLLLLARLGLRREDLRLLQIGDIDLGQDEIRLRHVKGGGEEVMPITFPDLRDALFRYLAVRSLGAAEYLIYPKNSRLQHLSRPGIGLWFERCCERSGVAGYTMHQLRHAAADDFYEAGGGEEGAKLLLRHKSSDTTRVYLHRSAADDLRRRIRSVYLPGEEESGGHDST